MGRSRRCPTSSSGITPLVVFEPLYASAGSLSISLDDHSRDGAVTFKEGNIDEIAFLDILWRTVGDDDLAYPSPIGNIDQSDAYHSHRRNELQVG